MRLVEGIYYQSVSQNFVQALPLKVEIEPN